jgi:hypothetical protein
MSDAATTTGLVLYDGMVRAIEAATTVDEVKEVHDKAIAVELYAIQARNEELEAKMKDFRVLAAHKGVAICWPGLQKAKGGRPRRKPSPRTRGLLKTVGEMGFTYDQSSEWQKLGDTAGGG